MNNSNFTIRFSSPFPPPSQVHYLSTKVKSPSQFEIPSQLVLISSNSTTYLQSPHSAGPGEPEKCKDRIDGIELHTPFLRKHQNRGPCWEISDWRPDFGFTWPLLTRKTYLWVHKNIDWWHPPPPLPSPSTKNFPRD